MKNQVKGPSDRLHCVLQANWSQIINRPTEGKDQRREQILSNQRQLQQATSCALANTTCTLEQTR